MSHFKIVPGSLFILLICILALIGCQKATPTDAVAKINGQYITINELKTYYAPFFKSPSETELTRQSLRLLLDEYIDAYLISLLPESAEISKHPEIARQVDAFARGKTGEAKTDTGSAIPRTKAEINEYRRRLIVNQYLKDNIDKAVSVSDEDITDYYENHGIEFSNPLRYEVRHILVPDRVKAGQIVDELREGAPFEDVAARESTCPSAAEGGALGNLTIGIMPEPFEKIMMALPVGEISVPVKTGFGYHVIKVDKRELGEKRPYATVKRQIREKLFLKEKNALMKNLLNPLRENAELEMYWQNLSPENFR
jgi:parvulin-like peptidyl-prolyl isomerase